MKILQLWYWIGLMCITVACTVSKEEQQRQDSIRARWERAEQVKEALQDSLARLNPDQYISVKVDSVVRFRRSRDGDEIHFSINNKTPFTYDSVEVMIYVSGLFGKDSILLKPFPITPKTKSLHKTSTHFTNVDSIAILHKKQNQ